MLYIHDFVIASWIFPRFWLYHPRISCVDEFWV